MSQCKNQLFVAYYSYKLAPFVEISCIRPCVWRDKFFYNVSEMCLQWAGQGLQYCRQLQTGRKDEHRVAGGRGVTQDAGGKRVGFWHVDAPLSRSPSPTMDMYTQIW